jgi:hypothetical protein
LTIPGLNKESKLWHDIWVKPTEPVSSIPVILDFWYKVDGDEKLIVKVRGLPSEIGKHNIGGCPILLEEELIWEWSDPENYEGPWQHFTSDVIEVDPESAVVRVIFLFTGRPIWVPGVHEMYIDDVVLTCSLLDMGEGGGGDRMQEASSRLPVLSNVTIHPNPFNPSAVIRFQMGLPNPVSLRIYDVLGRVVRTLVDDRLPAGKHSLTWDGKNNNGVEIASGVYFYKLSVAGRVVKGKLTLIK